METSELMERDISDNKGTFLITNTKPKHEESPHMILSGKYVEFILVITQGKSFKIGFGLY